MNVEDIKLDEIIDKTMTKLLGQTGEIEFQTNDKIEQYLHFKRFEN